MSVWSLVLVSVLFGVGAYLLMDRSLTRIALGVGALGNGVNVLIISAGSDVGEAPISGRDGTLTDPLPQALVLTAIVIGFALLTFLMTLAWRNWTISGNDEVEDDVEDRLVARRAERTAKSGYQPHHDDVTP